MSAVAVLGAAGGVGRAVTAELTAREHEVTAVTRDGGAPDAAADVRPVAADLADRAQAVAACAGSDVVVMAAQVPYERWATDLVPMVDNALTGAAQAGARLVMVDNLYAYGAPDEPITRETPEAATTRKGAIRRTLGHRLLAAHHEGRAPVAIGRFSDYYGPGGTNSLVYALGVQPALRGKRPRALIDADQPHTFHFLPDAARGFATLVEREEADGQVWILPAAPALTQRELLAMVASAAGLRPVVGRVTRGQLRLVAQFNRRLRELLELTEQWDRPYLTDSSAFDEVFGPLDVTPHDEAVARTVESFRSVS